MKKLVRRGKKTMAKRRKKIVALAKKRIDNQTMLVNFILDQSGSMASVIGQTIEGFNKYLSKLQEDTKTNYLFSLTLFNGNAVDQPHVATPLKQVGELNKTNYTPNGDTPLYDAIGNTIRLVEESPMAAKASKVLTVIMTDGHENASTLYTLEKVRKLIAEKEATGKWTFIYLGATLDAQAVAQTMGVAAGNAVRYAAASTAGTIGAVACSTVAFARSAMSSTKSFYDDTKYQDPSKASSSNSLVPPKDEEDWSAIISKTTGSNS